jgi:hypothetical protein
MTMKPFIVSIRRFFFVLAIFGNIPTGYACQPGPVPNTNWLNYDFELEDKTFLNSFEKKIEGDKVLYRDSEKRDFKYYGIISSAFNLNDAIWRSRQLEEGAFPTFSSPPSTVTIPEPKKISLEIEVGKEKKTLSGIVRYSKNPKFNPEWRKTWKNPCDKLGSPESPFKRWLKSFSKD